MAIQRIIDNEGLPRRDNGDPLQLALQPDYKPAPQPVGIPVTVGGQQI
jgi:hypothetical protein